MGCNSYIIIKIFLIIVLSDYIGHVESIILCDGSYLNILKSGYKVICGRQPIMITNGIIFFYNEEFKCWGKDEPFLTDEIKSDEIFTDYGLGERFFGNRRSYDSSNLQDRPKAKRQNLVLDSESVIPSLWESVQEVYVKHRRDPKIDRINVKYISPIDDGSNEWHYPTQNDELNSPEAICTKFPEPQDQVIIGVPRISYLEID